MSKFKIPSTQSSKDPYALERSVAGDTLKATANPIQTSTGGNELETLTPFQIEEGKGTLGNSQYQQQALQNQLSNDEDFWSLTAKGLKNLAGTVVTEIGKTPGYIGGGLAAVGNELFSDGKDSMKMMVDNSWVNAFESMDESIKNFMPVNISKEVQEGGLGDKLSSGAWWATTGAEGVGFLLAMYGPGALLKAGKVGQRIMSGIESLANQGVDVVNYLNLPIDTLKPYKMSLNAARNVDGKASILVNSVVESAAEAANTFDNIKTNKKQEYLNQGLPEDQAEQLANQDAGKGAAAVFKTNMVILPVSNLLEEKWLWKSVGLSGQDAGAEGLINQFMKNGVLDIDGLKNATRKTFKEQAGTYSKNFLKNVAKEGFFEEGLQTVTQQQVEKGNIKDNALSQFIESISQYANDFENNKELHESIALGGLLGGGSSIFQSINQARNTEEAIYGSKQGKFDGILNKIGLRQVRKDQRGLSNLLSENWINNFKSYDDLLTDGKLDQEKLVKLPQEQQSLANLHFLYDSAVETGDKLTQDIVGQYLATNYAQPFLGQVGGKQVFQQHVDNQVVPEWANRFKNLTGRDATNIEISEFKKRFLDSANPVFDNYTKVEDTHYPERYFQDKENPDRYKDFKNHYFKQKLQALTNVTAADKQIAESTTKITVGDNLSGIQKTNNKIANAEIDNANKVKQEAADYYESLFTKKGVKDLYDLYSKQEDTVNEVLEEVTKDQVKDAQVAEQKIENIQNAEAKLQQAESNQDQPVVIKTKDGRLLETILDDDGSRYVFDNGNVRPLTEDELVQSNIVQPEDVQREVQKQEIESENRVINKIKNPAKQEGYDISVKRLSTIKINNESFFIREIEVNQEEGDFTYSEISIFTLSGDKIANITLIPNKEKAAYKIDMIVVSDNFQGKGISTILYKESIKVAKANGYNNGLISSNERLLESEKTIHSRKHFVLEETTWGKEDAVFYTDTVDEYNSALLTNSVEPSTDTSNQIQTNEEPLDEKLHESFLQNDLGTGLYPSTGMHVSYDNVKGRIYDTLTSEGLPKLNDSVHQRNWFDTLDKITNINDYNVKVVNKTNANQEQLRVILENGGNQVQDTDLFIFLHKDDSPVLIDNNPVFTALWRPDTLYKELSQQSLSARLAPMTIYNSYLESIGISNQEIIEPDLSNFSPTEYNKLISIIGKENSSSDRLWYIAARWAKDDYIQWYNSLQQPNTFLQPMNITNGKRLVKRNQDRSIVWNPILGNVPGFSIKNQKLVNGDIVQQYTPQGVKVGNKYYNFGIGDSVLVSNDQAYRLKQSNLSSNEVKTVLYLLSLKDLNAPQESVNLPIRSVIKQKNDSGGFVDKVFENTPVFGSNTEYGLIKSLINFGYGTSKGSIYLNGNDVEYIDWDGNLQTVPIRIIKNTFLDNDFYNPPIEKLMVFLSNKKFNINENLLRADSDFQYPNLKRNTNASYTIGFENKGKYKAYLIQDNKVLTDSVIAEGYPKRLARNLQFAKQPTIQVMEESKVEEQVTTETEFKKEDIERRRQAELNDLEIKADSDNSNIRTANDYLVEKDKINTKYDLELASLEQINTQEKPKTDPRLEKLKNRKRTEMPDLNAFSKITEEDESIVASEKTIRDLAARMSDRIGIPYRIISDRTEEYKGKIENGVYYINLAYATLDTPIHEILGHPIIRTIKNKHDLTEFQADESNPFEGILKEENGYSKLYQNLLKELEYGRGKRVLDRVKRDYVNKRVYNRKIDKYVTTEYTLEEQQEEAIVTLLGLMTAEKLDKVKDGKLISLLKRLLKEMKAFMRGLFNQKEIEIDKLPDNMTLGDIADLLAYSNSKLILPGNEVVYTTPDNQTFKTYQEASNHISKLIKSSEEVDFSSVKLLTESDQYAIYNPEDGDVWDFYDTKAEADLELSKIKDKYPEYVSGVYGKTKTKIEDFISKNKEYEQTKEIIEEWKKINNIQYNPEEVYSRGQEFSSVVGAYSNFDVNLMMQNLLSHIEDNEKAGGKFAISAFTKPIDKIIGHLEGGGGKIKFKIYPQPNDILWATDQDAYSGSVWDASEKINKNKKSELLGVSYTKYPSLSNVSSVQPNLASIIDNLRDHHNELGIVLTGNNFRLEYDDNIPYPTKKILNSINAILDQKYGRLVKPKIDKVQKEPKLLQWTIKPVGPGSKTEWALEYLYSDNFNDYSGDVKFFDTKEEAELFVKTLDKKSNQQIGVQPTQTNETLKIMLSDIKYNKNTNRPKSIEELKEGDLYLYREESGKYYKEDLSTEQEIEISKEEYYAKPEYLSQALINTKISKLKEVAKKYPRSLIRSEVKQIGYSSDALFDMFEDELPFSKITKKVSPLRRRIEELRSRKNKSLPSLNVDKIFSPTDMLNQKLQSGEITKYCK